MRLIEKFKFIYHSALQAKRTFEILSDSRFENNRIEGEIKRNTHSIEKGLSLENPRMGFGIPKIKEAFCLVERYINNGGGIDAEPLLMFKSALKAYLDFHKQAKFTNASIEEVAIIYNKLSSIVRDSFPDMGGVFQVNKPEYSEQEKKAFEKLFYDRHSIREFDHTRVEDSKLRHAIELAMRCPSACNRQCQRCYIVDKEQLNKLGSLSGIGGFAEDVDKFIVITGRISDYRADEYMQWIVTGSVFAAYLTLAIQAEGLGACFVQRSLTVSNGKGDVYNSLGIPDDEQMICLIAVGNLKDKYIVPQSYRLSFKSIVKCI